MSAEAGIERRRTTNRDTGKSNECCSPNRNHGVKLARREFEASPSVHPLIDAHQTVSVSTGRDRGHSDGADAHGAAELIVHCRDLHTQRRHIRMHENARVRMQMQKVKVAGKRRLVHCKLYTTIL